MENTNNHSMKSTTKHVMNNITIAILAAAVAISMAACAAAQPAETTAPTQPITAAAPATQPVETEPAETEPPVTLDYNAAANYGNSYAASTYGWIVDSSVDSYYPACRIEIDYAVNNGGQDCINSWMAGTVDATAWNLGEGLFGVWCECWEDDGCVFFQVCYG